MVGRQYNVNNSCRFGFQGQEVDTELKGEGNSINFQFRCYDPRIGRFFSVDPLSDKYPLYSPYHFSSNQPLHTAEYEGLESEFDLNLPLTPYEVDEGHWKFDPNHLDPNGFKWTDKNGYSLYWAQGKTDVNGKPLGGWEGKDHFHVTDPRGRRLTATGELAPSKSATNAHLTPGTQTSIKLKVSVSTIEVNGVTATTTKTTPTGTTSLQKMNGTIKSVFLVTDVVNSISGIVTGDPDSYINRFGNAQVGQLKRGTLDFYEMGPYNGNVDLFGNYYMITKEVTKVWTENGEKYTTVTRYLQHYEEKQKVNGRYIGKSEVGPVFHQTNTYKNGKLIETGKVQNPNNSL